MLIPSLDYESDNEINQVSDNEMEIDFNMQSEDENDNIEEDIDEQQWSYGGVIEEKDSDDNITTLQQKLDMRLSCNAYLYKDIEQDIKNIEKKRIELKKNIIKEDEINDNSEKSFFSDLKLSRSVLKTLEEMGYKHPTPIQRDSIPYAINGRDILATAETGSGKSAAFLLPIIERLCQCSHIQSRKRKNGKIITNKVATKVLVLLPTRELATQCFSMLEKLSKYTLITSALVAGGFSMKEQIINLKTQPDILICTPGRILDHLLNTQSVGLELLEIIVFDEADRLLEMGFRDECREILKRCSKQRQTLLFSATLNQEVQDLASIALVKPIRISSTQVNKVTKNLRQEFINVPDEDLRESTLVSLCTTTYLNNVIIFCSTKKQCHRLAVLFGLFGLKCSELHGDLQQNERCLGIENFQSGKTNYLLATDLASRGLDIKGVECVINYEVPNEDTKYIHRVGRTARAGESGQSVTLHCGEDEYKKMKRLAKLCTKNIEDNKSTLTRRTLDLDSCNLIKSRIEEINYDINDIISEEKQEKEMQLAEVDINKIQNLDRHKELIKARPKKVWLLSNNQKEQQREDQKEQRRLEKEQEEKTKTRKEQGRKKRLEKEKKDHGHIQKTAKRKFKRTGEDPNEKKKVANKKKKERVKKSKKTKLF